jgi:hypothetical protein
MHLGQTQIEDQQVELGVGHQRSVALSATGYMVDHGAGAAQCAQQSVGKDLIVLGNQNSHDWLLVVITVSAAGVRIILGDCGAKRAVYWLL